MKNASIFIAFLTLMLGCKKSEPKGECSPSFGVYDGCPLQQRPVKVTVTCALCTVTISSNAPGGWTPYVVGGTRTEYIQKTTMGSYEIKYKSMGDSKGIKIEFIKEGKNSYIINNENLIESDGEKSLGLAAYYFDRQK